MIVPIVVEPVVVPVPLTIVIAIEVEHAAVAIRVADNYINAVYATTLRSFLNDLGVE